MVSDPDQMCMRLVWTDLYLEVLYVLYVPVLLLHTDKTLCRINKQIKDTYSICKPS